MYKYIHFFIVALATTLLVREVEAQAARPNIIYIYADDMGYRELGAYGQKKIKTPHLDDLAREGMRFTQHYTSSPVCAPARCMLLTGKHGGHAYIRGNYPLGGDADSLEAGQMPLPDGTFTIPHMLKKAGYATGMTGKWGLGMHNNTGSPLKQGFDYYFGYLDQKQAHNYYPSHLWENDEIIRLSNPYKYVHTPLDPATAVQADFDTFKGNEYAPELMTERALRFIDQHQKAPFFLYMPYTIPHVSLQVPDEYLEQYQGQFADAPYYGQQGYASNQYPRATYAAMISYLDAQVGLVMQKVKELGLDHNTIIMFSSDNGTTFNGGVDFAYFNSVNGLRGLKMDVFEGGMREPFIVRWPGKIAAGTTSDHISAQYDLMATLAELTGQDPGNTDGLSFLNTLLGKPQEVHDYLYFEYPEKGGQLAIRMGDWKGVKLDVRRHPEGQWLLFNLRIDASEQHDVAHQYPLIVARFDEIVKIEHQPAHITEWEIVDPKITKTPPIK